MSLHDRLRLESTIIMESLIIKSIDESLSGARHPITDLALSSDGLDSPLNRGRGETNLVVVVDGSIAFQMIFLRYCYE